jgi:hypothetical protein
VRQDLRRRLDRAAQRLCPADDAAIARARRIAEKAITYEGVLGPLKDYCAWLDEKSAGRRLTLEQTLARLGGWMNEDPRGMKLSAPLGNFIDRAVREMGL